MGISKKKINLRSLTDEVNRLGKHISKLLKSVTKAKEALVLDNKLKIESGKAGILQSIQQFVISFTTKICCST